MRAAAAAVIYANREDTYKKHIKQLLEDAEDFKEEIYKECDKCEGTGKQAKNCLDCKGSGECTLSSCHGGTVEIQRITGSVTAKCHKCKGTGRCTKCNGEGSLDAKCFKCMGKKRICDKKTLLAQYKQHVNNAVKWRQELAEKAERERKEAEEQKRLAAERAERERKEAEEQKRLAAERAERERKEATERAERKRKETEEKQRLAAELAARERMAEKCGDAEEMFAIGNIYYRGEGVEKDDQMSVKWWRKAAEHGHAMAQYLFYLSFVDSIGGMEDDVEALKWLRKSAEQGNKNAIEALRKNGVAF